MTELLHTTRIPVLLVPGTALRRRLPSHHRDLGGVAHPSTSRLSNAVGSPIPAQTATAGTKRERVHR